MCRSPSHGYCPEAIDVLLPVTIPFRKRTVDPSRVSRAASTLYLRDGLRSRETFGQLRDTYDGHNELADQAGMPDAVEPDVHVTGKVHVAPKYVH